MLDGLPDAGGRERKKLEEVARAFARGDLRTGAEHDEDRRHVDEAMAVFGLVADGPVLAPPQEIYLWPENVESWALFLACQTQWRGGMEREGLDYDGVHRVIDQRRAWFTRRRQRFADVQVLERAVLEEWRVQRAKDG